MNRDPLEAWLERAAAGARDVLADYAAVTFRGTAYPQDTETLPEAIAYYKARGADMFKSGELTIPDSLRKTRCDNCDKEAPLEVEYRGERRLCKGCNLEVMQEWEIDLAEDRAKQAYEFRHGYKTW